MEYDDLFDYFTTSYVREFGQRKFQKVLNKVLRSNKISGLISTARYNGVPPGSDDILYCLNEIPFFIFSRGQTQVLGAFITLQRWHEEVNSQQFLLNEAGLKVRALSIIEKSRSTFF
jgi:hypothetical protein